MAFCTITTVTSALEWCMPLCRPVLTELFFSQTGLKWKWFVSTLLQVSLKHSRHKSNHNLPNQIRERNDSTQLMSSKNEMSKSMWLTMATHLAAGSKATMHDRQAQAAGSIAGVPWRLNSRSNQWRCKCVGCVTFCCKTFLCLPNCYAGWVEQNQQSCLVLCVV